jgi:nitric oxide dioxygenase
MQPPMTSPVKPLTEKQRQIVTASFARIVPITSEATATFYNHLWEIAPETKRLFQNTDMTQQGMKLMQTLGMAVRALHDPDSIMPMLRDLGKRHIGYGVTIEQYELIRAALLRMIEHSIGRDFNDETRDAWNAAYDLIADMTTSAYRS